MQTIAAGELCFEPPSREYLLSRFPESYSPPMTPRRTAEGFRFSSRSPTDMPGRHEVTTAYASSRSGRRFPACDTVANADEPWSDRPERSALTARFCFAEGVKWVSRTPRGSAFEKLAKRGGGLVVLHWGMGTRQAESIDNFVKLFGGCHGGPDRKYKILTTSIKLRGAHPILRGIEPVEVEDEFYYRLEFPRTDPKITPLVDVDIDGESHTVAWSYARPDGGRSAGFSGGHFHKNWKLPSYRRLVTQSILWSVGIEIPKEGISVDVPENSLELRRPAAGEERMQC
jgi:type 1 glutamine amidotransferase